MNKEEMRAYQQERRRRFKEGLVPATKRGPQGQGANAWLSTFEVGEVRWIETTLEKYTTDQRCLNIPKDRRSVEARDWLITTALFTAVSSSRAGDIHYLIRVERLS